MLSKKVIVFLLCVFFISMFLYFWSETSLFFGQPSIQPIRTYYRVQIVPIPVQFPNETHLYVQPYGFVTPNFTISVIDLRIDDPFIASNAYMTIKCENLTQLNFWDSPVNGMFELNGSRIQSYEKHNVPDLQVSCPIFNDSAFTWIQVMLVTQPISIACKEPFLKQTGFNTYEGEFLFDEYPSNIETNNGTFIPSNLQKLSFEVTVPDHYNIENADNLNSAPNGFKVTKEIGSGEIFHLTVTDNNLEQPKAIISVFSYLGFASTALGLIIGELFTRWKK
jgi:hypothetical protein